VRYLERWQRRLADGILCSQCESTAGLAARTPDRTVPESERTKRSLSVLRFFVVKFTPIGLARERKTPEMRAQMTDIERSCNSTAARLATAILKIWAVGAVAAGRQS